MKIYDISQEVFGCVVFPGDPKPERTKLAQMAEGSLYNLTALSMCAHNGTHVDAPRHFIADGKNIDEVSLKNFVGPAYVAEHEGELTGDDAIAVLERAREADSKAVKRILIKGKVVVSEEGQQYLLRPVSCCTAMSPRLWDRKTHPWQYIRKCWVRRLCCWRASA